MESNSGIYALIIAPLTAAIAWLAIRLYDGMRKELDEAIKDRDKLRAIVDQTYARAAELAQLRDDENRKLRDELSALRATVESRTPTGGSHVGDAQRRRRADDA